MKTATRELTISEQSPVKDFRSDNPELLSLTIDSDAATFDRNVNSANWNRFSHPDETCG